MIKLPLRFAGFLSILLWLASCNSKNPVHEFTEIPDGKWGWKDTLSYSFELKEESGKWKPVVQIRHSADFVYENLYVLCLVTKPDGTKSAVRANLILADELGHWKGKGFGKRKEISFRIGNAGSFSQKGTYKVQLLQYMRENPLEGIIDAGFRLDP